jgi:lipocalin
MNPLIAGGETNASFIVSFTGFNEFLYAVTYVEIEANYKLLCLTNER